MFVNSKHNMNAKDKKAKGSNPSHDPDKCYEAMRLASRLWAHFVSEVDDGRDLFRRENYQRIREVAQGLDCQSSGGAFSAALKQEWGMADQVDYNRRAREYVDVFQ